MKKVYPERSRRGFTLIELVVAIVIVGLLIVGGVSALGVKRKEKDVKATAEKLRTYIMEARSMAMTPEDTDFGLQKIQVRVYGTGRKVSLYKIKELSDEQIFQNFEIPNNITILPSGSGAPDGNMRNTPSYHYFSFVAADVLSIGKITDCNNCSAFPIRVTVSSTGESSELIIDTQTGSVTFD